MGPTGQTTPRIRLQEPASAQKHGQATPHHQQRRIPVKRARTRHSGICHLSGQSRRKPSKRAPDLRAPPASDPEGYRKRSRLPTLGTANEAPWERRHQSQQRKRTRTQPRTDQPKKSEESKVDAMSGEQEHWSKPRTVCPGQRRRKEKGKRPKTREHKYKKTGDLSSQDWILHSKEEGISMRPHEITESWRTWSPRKSRAHGPESINSAKCHTCRRWDAP